MGPAPPDRAVTCKSGPSASASRVADHFWQHHYPSPSSTWPCCEVVHPHARLPLNMAARPCPRPPPAADRGETTTLAAPARACVVVQKILVPHLTTCPILPPPHRCTSPSKVRKTKTPGATTRGCRLPRAALGLRLARLGTRFPRVPPILRCSGRTGFGSPRSLNDHHGAIHDRW